MIKYFTLLAIFFGILQTGAYSSTETDLFKHEKKIEKKQKNYNKLNPGWNLGLSSSLTVTQTAYHEWASGGSDVLVWTATTNGTAIYDTLKWNWANESKLMLGYARQNGANARKTDDLVDIESVITYKDKRYLNPYFSLNFRTQMATGYSYKDDEKKAISGFFDPAYLINGLGIGYAPKKTFRTRLGLATRTLFTRRYNEYSGNRNIQFDSGLQWVTHAERKIWDSLLLRSQLRLFSSFDDFKRGNISWDTLMQASITDYIIINLETYVIYDARVSPYTQVKEILSIGLRYIFI